MPSNKDIREVALRYLEHRNRTKMEMENHLYSKNFNEKDIESVIESLEENKYIDDVRFAEDYFRYGYSKRRGTKRIKRELKEFGVSFEDVEDGLFSFEKNEEVDHMELEREGAIMEAGKIIEGKEMDQKLVAKVSRRLATRGYDSNTIYETVGKFMREENE